MGVYKEILEILQPGETVLKVHLPAPLSLSLPPLSLCCSLYSHMTISYVYYEERLKMSKSGKV